MIGNQSRIQIHVAKATRILYSNGKYFEVHNCSAELWALISTEVGEVIYWMVLRSYTSGMSKGTTAEMLL